VPVGCPPEKAYDPNAHTGARAHSLSCPRTVYGPPSCTAPGAAGGKSKYDRLLAPYINMRELHWVLGGPSRYLSTHQASRIITTKPTNRRRARRHGCVKVPWPYQGARGSTPEAPHVRGCGGCGHSMHGPSFRGAPAHIRPLPQVSKPLPPPGAGYLREADPTPVCAIRPSTALVGGIWAGESADIISINAAVVRDL
jgi:hypothetical protein